MNKKILYSLLIIISLFIIIGCNKNIKNNNKDKEIKIMKVIINDKEYTMKLEDNKTVKSFIKLLPKEFNMQELNGNEKYVYLDKDLPINSYNPKKINTGDVMLFGNNCLVLFYKSFNTSYSYTKIGHIDNLDNIDNSDINIKFYK